jgi:cytoplasmic tRNA 2-thiolation protein 2
MIGFSGGLGSTVLLDLVKACYFTHMDAAMSKGGKEHPRKSGRAWGRAIVCFVDCSEGYARVRRQFIPRLFRLNSP